METISKFIFIRTFQDVSEEVTEELLTLPDDVFEQFEQLKQGQQLGTCFSLVERNYFNNEIQRSITLHESRVITPRTNKEIESEVTELNKQTKTLQIATQISVLELILEKQAKGEDVTVQELSDMYKSQEQVEEAVFTFYWAKEGFDRRTGETTLYKIDKKAEEKTELQRQLTITSWVFAPDVIGLEMENKDTVLVERQKIIQRLQEINSLELNKNNPLDV